MSRAAGQRALGVVPDGATAPTLLMDAGTGIRTLPDLLGPELDELATLAAALRTGQPAETAA